MTFTWQILQGSCLKALSAVASESIHCCVTSPPYWGLRDYGAEGQMGLEKTPEEYVSKLVAVFREVRRVLRNDATLWLNLGDSYANSGCATGLKPKDLVGIPWRVAFALQVDGWYLRSDIIWYKQNPMPESVADRPTKAHEYVFLLSKSSRYYFGQNDVREPVLHPTKPHSSSKKTADQENAYFGNAPTNLGRCGTDPSGRNIRTVWPIVAEPCKEAHFAVMPRDLARRCILAGCPISGTVLDPFGGTGTVAIESIAQRRNAVIVELKPAYVEIARRRIRDAVPMFSREVV